MQGVKVLTALDGVTTSSTSTAMWVGDYERIGLLFSAAAISSGNGVFSLQVSQSGNASDVPTSWVNYNMLIDNVTNSNVQTLTRVASKTLSANGDVLVWLDTLFPVTHLRTIVVRTTDGTYTVKVIGFSQFES
jgi:hypothetical protein